MPKRPTTLTDAVHGLQAVSTSLSTITSTLLALIAQPEDSKWHREGDRVLMEDEWVCAGCNEVHDEGVAMGLDASGDPHCYPSATRLELFPCQHCGVLVPCTESLGHTGSEEHPTEYLCSSCFPEHSVLSKIRPEDSKNETLRRVLWHREDAPEPCPLCGITPPLVDSQTHTTASGDECEGVCPDCSLPVSYDDALEQYLHVDTQATCFMQQTSTDLLKRPRVACDGCGTLMLVAVGGTHGGGDPLCKDCFDKTQEEFDRLHAEDEAAIAARHAAPADVICPLCNQHAERADGEWGECGLCVNCGRFLCEHAPPTGANGDRYPDMDCAPRSFVGTAADRRSWILSNICQACDRQVSPSETYLNSWQHHRVCSPCFETECRQESEADLVRTKVSRFLDSVDGDEPVALYLVQDDIHTLLMACDDSVSLMESLLEEGMEDDRTTMPPRIKDVKRLRDQILALQTVTR